jgi:hypothetical protein
MEQRGLIKDLREEGHGSIQIYSKFVEHDGHKAVSYPILMLALACSSFASGEKPLKIGDAAERRQISKLISESKEHSKHRPMLQFETLLQRQPSFCHRYSMSSLKFFMWNCVTRDRAPTNRAMMRSAQEYNLLFRGRPSLRGPSAGTGRSSTLLMSPGYYGRISRKDAV